MVKRVACFTFLILFILSLDLYASNDYFEIRKNNNGSISIGRTVDGRFYPVDVRPVINHPDTGKKLPLNLEYVQKSAKFVYGTPDDVDPNDVKGGEWRYLGYTKDGNLFSNDRFPNDVNTGLRPWEKDWIKEPWNRGLCEKSEYNRDPNAAEWLDTLGWDEYEHVEDRVPLSGTNLQNYLAIQSPMTNHAPGSARGYHDFNGRILYQTFSLMPRPLDFKSEKTGQTAQITEAEEGSTVTLKVKVTCYTSNHKKTNDWTKTEWSIDGEAKRTNQRLEIDQEAEDTFSFTMPNHDVEVKYFANCKLDKNIYELYTFDDNYVKWQIKSIPKTTPVEPPAEPSEDNANPTGQIKFNPESSTWTNRDINVQAAVAGDKQIKKTATASRSYTYSTQTCSIDGTCITTQHTGVSTCGYSQTWKVGDIDVEGALLNPDSKRISDGGQVTLTDEGYGTLDAQLTRWVPEQSMWNNTPPPQGTWMTGDPPQTTAPAELYPSQSGEYRIDKTPPYEAQFLWDSQAKKIGTQYEYMCDKDNTIEIRYGDNLSGVSDIRYLWSRSSDYPQLSEMKPLGLTTAQKRDEKKETAIKLHDSIKYSDLRKGMWYLHIYQKDRAGNETKTTSPSIYINKLENLRITAIYDYNWKDYFKTREGRPTALSTNGIKTPHMPVYTNKEEKGIKLGYGVKLKLDTMGFNQDDDTIQIEAKYYAMDKKSNLYPADIYVENKEGDYIKLENSQFKTTAKTITLTKEKNRTAHELETGKSSYNTWSFEIYLPYKAKAVLQGEKLDLVSNNTFDYRLLVVLDITGRKTDGRSLNYTAKETDWGNQNGSIYGKNKPTKLSLLGAGQNNGEVFWYMLNQTAQDDFNLDRQW